jgi:putative flippase GtrA
MTRRKILDRLRRARKAFVGTAGSLVAAVVAFAPDYADEYKVGVGAVAAVLTGLIVYFTSNTPVRS